MTPTISGFTKNAEIPSAAAPPISGNVQHKAQAAIIPKPANHSFFFIYITFHQSYTVIIKLKVNFKSRG